MSLQDIINSAPAIRTGLWLAKRLSPAAGYRLADFITGRLARSDSAMMRTIRQNQAMVLGPGATPAQIEAAARAALRQSGRINFDLYHALGGGKEAVISAVTFTPQTEAHLQRLLAHPQGSVVVGGHLSNFDLAALAYAARDIPAMMLAFPTPTSGYDVQNEIRSRWGFDLEPIGVSTLRRAITHLRGGGMVVTGIDRPDPLGSGEMLPFFGRPARLPVGHVRLALQTGALLTLGLCRPDPARPHHYLLELGSPQRIELVGDRRTTLIYHATRILAELEGHIRRQPEQWLMFHPLWQEAAVAALRPAPAAVDAVPGI